MFQGDKEITEYKLTDEDYANIEKLMKERYSTWEWNFGESPEFNIEKSKRFSTGKVETKINVEDGIIKFIKFYGDFFGGGEISNIGDKFIGIKYKEDEIKKVLDTIDIGYYFLGISKDEIINCII